MASITLNNIVKKYDDGFPAVNNVSLDIADGEFVILVGPSGCGKSTLLRMIVGLEDITSGELQIDGTRMNEAAPRDRNLAMVFQNYALYPHLTVYENIAFPLRLAKKSGGLNGSNGDSTGGANGGSRGRSLGGAGGGSVDDRVRKAAEMLELTEHLERKPANLSGGQRQRVAMGRAIVRQADAFLFDEPLSNLDAKLRGQMRAEIAQLQRRLGVTSVYVTHDQTEAMTLGDRVAVLKKGELQQVASPRELYEQPVNLFVAGFIGSPSMNFLPATLKEGSAGAVGAGGSGGAVLSSPIGDIPISAEKAAVAKGHELLMIGLRPEFFEDAQLVDEAKKGKGAVFTAELSHLEWLGHEQYGYIEFEPDEKVRRLLSDLAAEMDADELRPQVVTTLSAESRVRPGQPTDLWVDTSRIHIFDPESGENLTRDAEAGAELTRMATEERERELELAAAKDG